MIKILLVTLFVISYPQVLFADCYADYKAKKNKPLRLHYGIARIDPSVCKDRDAAVLDLRARLQTNGWILLKLMDFFDQEGLEERKENAGAYFLKY